MLKIERAAALGMSTLYGPKLILISNYELLCQCSTIYFPVRLCLLSTWLPCAVAMPRHCLPSESTRMAEIAQIDTPRRL
jgi:hypothetical protein